MKIEDVLAQLGDEDDSDIHHRLAINPKTPTATLDKLSHTGDMDVMIAVANNKNTSPSALQTLFHYAQRIVTSDDDYDLKYEIMYALAKNYNTPIQILKQLNQYYHLATIAIEAGFNLQQRQGDAAYDAKILAAKNKTKINESADLEKAHLHIAKELNREFKKALELEDGMMDSDKEQAVRALLKNPNVPVLRMFVKHKDMFFNRAMLDNPKLPVEILRQIYDSASLRQAHRIAHNPETPIDILKGLANDADEDFEVQQLARHNILNRTRNKLSESSKMTDLQASFEQLVTELSPKIKMITLKDNKKTDTQQQQLNNKNGLVILQNIAANKNTHKSTLLKLSKSPWYEVRLGVAFNPSTSIKILQNMLTNPKEFPPLKHQIELTIQNRPEKSSALIYPDIMHDIVSHSLKRHGITESKKMTKHQQVLHDLAVHSMNNSLNTAEHQDAMNDFDVLDNIMSNGNTHGDTIKHLYRNQYDGDPELDNGRQYLVSDRDVATHQNSYPEELHDIYIKDLDGHDPQRNWQIRDHIITHLKTSLETLKLAAEKDPRATLRQKAKRILKWQSATKK